MDLNSIKKFMLDRIEFILKKGYLEKINKAKNNRIILLKPDAIGDYIIARNLMNYYIQHPSNKNAEFYLVAGSKLKTLIDKTDRPLYKELIYLDNAAMAKFKGLYSFYFRLKKINSSSILFPVYSPTHAMDELVMMTGAKNKIGIRGDLVNKPSGTFPKGKVQYTSQIAVDGINNAELNHEFLKYKIFFEAVLKEAIPVQKPSLPATITKTKFNRIVICVGSTGAYKIWAPENYARLTEALKKKYPDFRVDVICGPGEKHLEEAVLLKTNKFDTAFNICDISQLCAQLEKCDLVISNDSAPVHIAAAYDVPSLCVFNGSHYGRFVPYPTGITTTSFVVLPPAIVQEMAANKPGYMQYLYQHLTNENINTISVDEVFEKASSILSTFA